MQQCCRYDTFMLDGGTNVHMRANWKECAADQRGAQWSGLYITMNRKGSIVMTKHTHQRLGEPKAFILMFDTVNSRIGLKPTSPSSHNAYKVGPSGKYGGKVVYAYRLAREFGIDLPETIEFQNPEIDQDGILVLDLRTARVSSRVWTKQRHAEWQRKHSEGNISHSGHPVGEAQDGEPAKRAIYL